MNDPLYASFDSILHHRKPHHLGQVHVTGFVDEKDLPALYQSAFVFVNVSTKEGCNLPLLEALVSGIPVITSDIPVHHEMIGHHAVYTGVNDAGRLGSIMDQFIRDEQFYNARCNDAQKYKCPFSWQISAEGIANVYEKLLKSSSI